MSLGRVNVRRVAILELVGSFVVLAVVAFVLFAMTSLASGLGWETITSPRNWLSKLDRDGISSILFTASQVIAGLLSIAITVSAIVVELAANRYNHRITWLFVREPTNIVVMSLFVVTTLQCIWIAVTYESRPLETAPPAAFLVTMTLITVCLLLLLPYFAFVFRFLSPLSIVDKIRSSAYHAIERGAHTNQVAAKQEVLVAIDELQDVARSAAEQSDRSVAMACITALGNFVTDYQSIRTQLPASWFISRDAFMDDPDFVSVAPSVIDEVEREGLWIEVKVFRQYISLMGHCVPRAREVANMIAIVTHRIGVEQARRNPALLELTIRCFNTYLRTSINASDARTSYYVLNQYRLLAEALMDYGFDESVRDIARYFKFYGQLAHERGQSFLMQVAAVDVARLVEASLDRRAQLTDDLLAIVLEMDRDVPGEADEHSLLGVRRVQLQLVTLFAARGEEERARRICNDLAGEQMLHLERLRHELETATNEEYWEITDRGISFAYLPPERRAQLPIVLNWIRDATSRRSL